MPISALLSQIAVSLVVVLLYHLWASRKKQPAAAPPPVPAPVMAPPKAPPTEEPTPPETLAVIAAAIAVILDRPHQVVSVQQDAARMPDVNVWALEGRMKQFMSHKVR